MKKTHDVSGRDFYASLYKADLDRQVKWLEYGATEKAESVSVLLKAAGVQPESLLELGCGTGAVIRDCARRGLASSYTAVDHSKEAIAYLKNNAPEIDCVCEDITQPGSFSSGSYDVIVLSHVLEHLEDPLSFLKAVKERLLFKCLIVEVPLEDLPVMRLKGFFSDRNRNTAGHVQFFTATSFNRLLRQAGFRVTAERRFVPRMSTESIKFSNGNNASKVKLYYKLVTACYAPRLLEPFWKMAWYSHLAVLCELA